MLVVVGSQNPVKIKAVKEVFNWFYPAVKIKGVKVASEVADQPMSFKESYQGAVNRAKKSLALFPQADFALGIEGGLQHYSFGWATAGVVVIINQKGVVAKGISSQLFLPSLIIKKIKKGKELGDVLDEITGRKNMKQQEGAFGLFTKNFVSRQQAYVQAVALALARFLKKDLYES